MSTYPYPSTDSLLFPNPPSRIEENLTLPTLEAVHKGQPILPAYSLILGLCRDQLPLVLDLTEPNTGAFLIAADSGFANTTLLHSILASAFLLNTESEVNVHLISPQADSLTRFHTQPNLKICFQPERMECEIVLEEIVNLIVSRQQLDHQHPVHVLFIDSLDLLWEQLSPQGRERLKWIAANGPHFGFAVFAAIETGYLKPKLNHLVDCFPSRILGRIRQTSNARYLAGFNHSDVGKLIPDLEFLTIAGGQSFNICLLPAEQDR